MSSLVKVVVQKCADIIDKLFYVQCLHMCRPRVVVKTGDEYALLKDRKREECLEIGQE